MWRVVTNCGKAIRGDIFTVWLAEAIPEIQQPFMVLHVDLLLVLCLASEYLRVVHGLHADKYRYIYMYIFRYIRWLWVVVILRQSVYQCLYCLVG